MAKITKRKKAGSWYKAWSRFKKNKLSLAGLVLFGLFVFLGIFCPYFPLQDPWKQNWGFESVPPSKKFLFGTDNLGRDLFSRIIWGTRTSLIVGSESVFILVILGILFGSISGFVGGYVDNFIMRGTDIFLSIPRMILLIVIASMLRSKSILFTGLIIGLTSWPRVARVVRSNFLSLKKQPFVEASKAMGASNYSIIFQHILPNTLSPVIVLATMSMGSAILTESGLSFLGIGNPVQISWGHMLSIGNQLLRRAWWHAVYPGLFIFSATLGFNLLGDGLRDALDVRM